MQLGAVTAFSICLSQSTSLLPLSPPPPIVIDGEEEWEVEEILDSRWHRKRFQFLVKWKGFSREHNSWEAASDVKAPDLVTEYYRKHPAAPSYQRMECKDILVYILYIIPSRSLI